MKKVLIAPSILSADFTNLEAEIREVEKAKADIIHIDVMDGHFVPNITIGPIVIEWIRKRTQLPLDVHLMITDPLQYIDAFRAAGSDWITIHSEADSDVKETVARIKASGAKAGICIKPKTQVDDALRSLLPLFDLVLIMSVEPGFGGQSFMPEVLPKIAQIRETFEGMISIDGGINLKTAPEASRAGVDIVVAGSAVFGAIDRAEAIRSLSRPAKS
jgi:ribulose-phosphate 3-epimerase